MVCGVILEDGKLLFYLWRDSQSDIIDYIVAHFMIEGMGVMRFYDKGLKAYVEIKEEDGNSILYIKGIRYPVQISPEALKQYPDWVAKDVVQLLARRIYRKSRVDQLAETIIKERS